MRAATAPSTMVSNMPALNKRVGRLRMFRSTFKSVRLASVKSSNTRPISARRRKASRPKAGPSTAVVTEPTSMPAAANTMGAVTIVCSSRRDTRL